MAVTASLALGATGSTSPDNVIITQSAPGALPATLSGATRWVDIYGFCRAIDGPAAQAPLPLGSSAEWQAFRQNAPASLAQTVCCRPKTVTLCQGAAGGTVSETLPYTAYGSQATPVATCRDQWGLTYTDAQTWTCGQTGTGFMADGLWTGGTDSWACAANAHVDYGGCSTAGVGGWGTQTVTVWNSCGQVQSSAGQACYSIPPCTPNWQTSCGSCNQTTGEKTCTTYDAKNCPGSTSSSNTQTCTWTQVGGAYCTQAYEYSIMPKTSECYLQEHIYCGCGDNICPSNWDTWGAGYVDFTTMMVGCAPGTQRVDNPPNTWGIICALDSPNFVCMGYQ